MNKHDDYAVVEAMIKYGGSFAEALGRAARAADGDNYARLKKAFPEVWERYAKFVTPTSTPWFLKKAVDFL